MTQRIIVLGALTALFGAGLITASTAAADASPGRADVVDTRWVGEDRRLDFTYDAEGFQYQSRRSSNLGEDLIQANFDLASATYEHEFISTEPGNETVVTTGLVFEALIEFQDRDRDGRYGVGDNTVNRIDLAGHPGAVLSSESSLATGARQTTVVFPLNERGDGLPPINGGNTLDGGSLRLSFYVAPTRSVVDNVAVEPTAERIGVDITDYPYDANATGTRLALAMRMTTSAPQSATPAGIAGQEGFFDVGLTWDEKAAADSGRVDVGVAALTETSAPADGTFIAIAYPRAQQIDHGLMVKAIRYESQGFPDVVEALVKGDWRLYAVGTLFSAAVVGVPAALRLRRGG